MDALTRRSDEGRDLAAIRHGEVPNNLRSVDVRMGKPSQLHFWILEISRTQKWSWELYQLGRELTR